MVVKATSVTQQPEDRGGVWLLVFAFVWVEKIDWAYSLSA
jgi:hypothetical protein